MDHVFKLKIYNLFMIKLFGKIYLTNKFLCFKFQQFFIRLSCVCVCEMIVLLMSLLMLIGSNFEFDLSKDNV